MKFLITFFLVLFLFKSNGQEQCSIVIHPFDTVRNCYLADNEFSYFENGELIQKLKTDSLGYATIQVNIDKLGVIAGDLKFELMMFNYFIQPIQCFDTLIIEVRPQLVCWDGYFGNFYSFRPNEFELDSLEEQETILTLQIMKSLLQEIPEEMKAKIKLSLYLGYYESKQLIDKRITYINKLVNKVGIDTNQLVIENCLYDDLFICSYCDGCHYYYLKRQGNWFTKAIYRKLKSKKDKEMFNSRRSGIKIGWDTKKS